MPGTQRDGLFVFSHVLFSGWTVDHFEDDRHSDEVWTLVLDSVHWV